MICPSCQKVQVITEHNYGALFTCPSCQAVYFIDFDGKPEFGEISNEVPVDDPHIQSEPDLTGPASNVESLSDNFTEIQYEETPQEDAPPFNPIPEKVEFPVSGSSDSFTNIAQEISDFGNTDSQLASMNYNLSVSGIDNQQTKTLFKEAIEDSKFAWDAFEIMKSIKNGKVEITKMSPAKAYLLAKRLQFLDIEKKWSQNVLS